MSDESEADEYDPFEYVPDRIDAITADGLVAMHEALNEENTARLESMPIEEQGMRLWKMVEKGHISVSSKRGGER